MKKRFLFGLLICLLLFTALSPAVSAENITDLPYESYIYNSSDEPIAIPAPYAVSRILSGDELGVSAFSDLTDLYYDGEDRIYLCDTGNNRIIVTDKNFALIREITGFNNNDSIDTFSSPKGVFSAKGRIYIADSGKSRIVVLAKDSLETIAVLTRPEINLLGKDYTYTPVALAVDNAGRIYVIADGINQGLICLDEKGEFSTFLGAPSVVPNIAEALWRRFATKEQLARMQQYVPTEYSSLLIDKNGFIYAVSQSSEAQPVAKLNSDGDNVLPTLSSEPKYGDAAYTAKLGNEVAPYFSDIALDQNDNYYLLDSKQGKIYVYSKDGYLLYAFGAKGSQQGTFFSAQAVEIIGDTLAVTDGTKGVVTLFKLTDFGKSVQTALRLYNSGDYDAARNQWEDVYRKASGYVLTVIGLAKIDASEGDYSSAMERLKPIHERELYSKFFLKWRDEFIHDNFYLLLIIAAVIIVAVILICRLLKKSKKYNDLKNRDLLLKIKYGKYVIFHPFDGFWDIKREHRGNSRAATVILALFIICYAIRTQFSGYVVTGTISSEVNAIYNCLLIILPLGFWVVANWCFTALMDGEGNMRDIYTATCYSLTPYVLLSPVLFLMSHILAGNEIIFYTVANTVSIIWVLLLIFFGMMTTHNYSLSKSFFTALLTLVGICLIIFILLLFVNIIQEVFTFCYNIYKELVLRSY